MAPEEDLEIGQALEARWKFVKNVQFQYIFVKNYFLKLFWCQQKFFE
jgi:hypothetical protein